MTSQDLRVFLAGYEASHPDDVLCFDQPVSCCQDVTAVVWELAERGRKELLRFCNVVTGDTAAGGPVPEEPDRSGHSENLSGRAIGHKVVTNLFASRRRIERMLGAEPGRLHERYSELAAKPLPMRVLDSGPVAEHCLQGESLDLSTLPLLTHFATDLGPYITSGVIVAEHPARNSGNLSYHRAVVDSPTTLATSLHSRGDLWRMLAEAEARDEPLPVAMVIGSHPLFMLAASAREPFEVDERELAAGLFQAPLDVIRTPRHGLRVPATAEYVIEGTITAGIQVAEGPFGEFTGYSSDRSTHNQIVVDSVLHRADPLWLDVVGGNSDEHLNLARVPREAEMISKLRARFPAVSAVVYPNSGSHFHCYVAVEQRRRGEARQIMLALLGWDPYLKTVIAVDSDIDLSNDSEVLWALATHFQPDRDMFRVDGLPGSPLDPSSILDGTTARLALDASRGPDFTAERIAISGRSRERARRLVEGLPYPDLS